MPKYHVSKPGNYDGVVRAEEARLRGLVNECTSCNSAVGDQHKEDCVNWKRPVVLRVSLEFIVDVPHDWDAGLIEFQRNDGTWCVDNFVDELNAIREKAGCLCSAGMRFDYVEDFKTEVKA